MRGRAGHPLAARDCAAACNVAAGKHCLTERHVTASTAPQRPPTPPLRPTPHQHRYSPTDTITSQSLLDDINTTSVRSRRGSLQTSLGQVEWVADKHGTGTSNTTREERLDWVDDTLLLCGLDLVCLVGHFLFGYLDGVGGGVVSWRGWVLSTDVR